jgi:hypothetical protein
MKRRAASADKPSRFLIKLTIVLAERFTTQSQGEEAFNSRPSEYCRDLESISIDAAELFAERFMN